MKALCGSTFCVLAILVIQIESSCNIGPGAKPDPDDPNNLDKYYCKKGNATVLVKTTERFDCYDCTCGYSILSCCGVGYAGGTTYAEGCKKKELEDCCFEMVKIDNEDEVCESKKCPDPL